MSSSLTPFAITLSWTRRLMIACETGGLSCRFSTASNHSRTLSGVLALSGTALGGFGNIGIYSNAIDASNLHLKARGSKRSKRVQQLSGSGSAGAGSANMALLNSGSLSGFFRSCSEDGDRSRPRAQTVSPPRASESRTRAAKRRLRFRSTRPGACWHSQAKILTP